MVFLGQNLKKIIVIFEINNLEFVFRAKIKFLKFEAKNV